MGQITRDSIAKNMLPGLQTIFHTAYKELPTSYDKIATTVQSSKGDETYGWLGQAPEVREWVDERIPKGLSEFSYTIRNRKFENSIRVDREVIEDEAYGQIRIRIQQLANKARRAPEKLVFQLLANGFTNLAYDGQFFFDVDHAEGISGAQSNRGTAALTADSYQAARAAVQNFKDDQGEPLAVMPDVLVVPPALELTARRIVEADTIVESGAAVTNIYRGSATVIVSPYLTDATNWYLLSTGDVLKPLIFQERTGVEFDALEATSENGFFRDAYHYGTRRRCNVGYGDWRMAYGSIVPG